jgi:hypothetical protein
MHYIGAVVGNRIDVLKDRYLSSNFYNKWKIFVHPHERYLQEVLERVLEGLNGANVSGKVAINRNKLESWRERIILYVNTIWYPKPSEFFDKVSKLFPEDYQKKIASDLEADKYSGFTLPPKPLFTRQIGPALYIRQGGRSDREDVLEKGGNLDRYFKGQHWHLLRSPNELKPVLGKPIKEELKKKSEVQRVLGNA